MLLRGVLARQSAVRATIAGSITRPEVAAGRPGHRFGLIDEAVASAVRTARTLTAAATAARSENYSAVSG